MIFHRSAKAHVHTCKICKLTRVAAYKSLGFTPMHTVQNQVCQAPCEDRCGNSVSLIYGLVWNYDEGTFGIELGHRELHQNALSSPSHCFIY